MPWSVIFHEEFDPEFQELEEALQDELACARKPPPELGA
jgi:hypothetical protein